MGSLYYARLTFTCHRYESGWWISETALETDQHGHHIHETTDLLEHRSCLRIYIKYVKEKGENVRFQLQVRRLT